MPVLSGRYNDLFNFVIFGSWILYAMATASVIVLRRKRPDPGPATEPSIAGGCGVRDGGCAYFSNTFAGVSGPFHRRIGVDIARRPLLFPVEGARLTGIVAGIQFCSDFRTRT
ncbi:MAG: hypothetical protein U0Q16_11935 [Bryobacteraceae bacterium]